MFFLAGILMLLSPGQAAEPEADVDFTEQGRLELQEVLQRRPAVLGAATDEPSERPELYLDYTERAPTAPVGPEGEAQAGSAGDDQR